MSTLNIGQDFSLDPGGRYRTDGEGNGEAFREDCFRPALESLEPGEKLTIILDDGPETYGSSFIVEGFAGVVKFGYMNSEALLNSIEIVFSDSDFEFYKDKIVEHIKKANYNSETYTPTN